MASNSNGFKPGDKRPEGSGRAKGTVNKTTAQVKEVFAETFRQLQEDPDKPHALIKWAENNPTDFYKLASKLIPVQLTGKEGGDLTLNIILKDNYNEEDFKKTLKIA